MKHQHACVDDILMRGLDDWIQAAEVVSVVKSALAAVPEADILDLSRNVIRELVKGGLMIPGDVTTDGFGEWGLGLEAALDRIEREWVALGRRPGLGEVCWLSNTDTRLRFCLRREVSLCWFHEIESFNDRPLVCDLGRSHRWMRRTGTVH
jgi:hypothetical protein